MSKSGYTPCTGRRLTFAHVRLERTRRVAKYEVRLRRRATPRRIRSEVNEVAEDARLWSDDDGEEDIEEEGKEKIERKRETIEWRF